MFGLHSAIFLSSASHAVDALAKGAIKTGNFRSDHQMAKTYGLRKEIGMDQKSSQMRGARGAIQTGNFRSDQPNGQNLRSAQKK